MTTSWPMTAGDFVLTAMEELGVLSAGEEPDASEMAGGLRRLNGMLNTWSVEGLSFRDQTGTITIPAGSDTVTLPEVVAKVHAIRFEASPGYFRPLGDWAWDEYLQLPNRSQAGVPLAFSQSGSKLAVWPVPTQDTEFRIEYGGKAVTLEAPTDTLDVPQEWGEAIWLNLAVRMAPMFGTVGQVELTDLRQRAFEAYQRMLDADRPASYFLEPDLAGY